MNELKKQAEQMAKKMNISPKEAEIILINSILVNQTSLNSITFHVKEK